MTSMTGRGSLLRAIRRLLQLLVCVVIVLAIAAPAVGLAALTGNRRRNRIVQFLTPIALKLFSLAIGLRIAVIGTRFPAARVFVGNHVSYLDILAAGVGVGGVFVSRHDVQSWPVVGLLARIAGTVFLDRRSLRSAVAGSAGIIERAGQGVRMILFPEGKTTSGEQVGEFRPFLFRGMAEGGIIVQPFVIGYTDIGGVPLSSESKDLVYWYDPAPSFAAHGWRLIGLPFVRVTLAFLDPHSPPEALDNDSARRWAGRMRSAIVAAGEEALGGRFLVSSPSHLHARAGKEVADRPIAIRRD